MEKPEYNRKHLTVEQKNLICQMRIKGDSLQVIADTVGKTKQAISFIFLNYPSDGRKPLSKLPDSISETNAIQILSLYNSGKSIDEITEILSCTKDDVYNVFSLLRKKTDKRRQNENICYYPNIKKWMIKKNIKNKEFAAMLGVSTTTLRAMMYGITYLPLETAKKIKEITGLSLKEIYSEFYEKWVADYLKNNK